MDRHTVFTQSPLGQSLRQARRFRLGAWHSIEDLVTEEFALSIRWADAATGENGASCLRTWPHDLAGLAAGHALLETTNLAPKRAVVTQTGDRAFQVTLEPAPAAGENPLQPLVPDVLLEAMRAFIAAPGHWDTTGCFHRAGVFNPQTGGLMTRAEDIGRHNCMDRLAGWGNASGIGFADKVLLVSSRLTGSLTLKALRAGFVVLVGRAAVTTDAIGLAQAAGAALIGFARPDEERFTLFTDTLGRVNAG